MFTALLDKFTRMHAPLPKLAGMHDTRRIDNAMQVQELRTRSTPEPYNAATE